MPVTKQLFGMMQDGRKIEGFKISNEDGSYIYLSEFGAILQSVVVPDKNGKLTDVSLGYDNLESYVDHNQAHFGSTIGRYGNRIADAKFEMNGKTYQLALNEKGINNLHSGPDGYEYRPWSGEAKGDDSVVFSLISPDGDQGFPGCFKVSVTYTFTDDHTVAIEYHGISDADTAVNMTNHSYWNLNGEGAGLIMNHSLEISASAMTPVRVGSIPTGEIRKVDGTPFDFRKMKTIARDADTDDEQLHLTGGYDHNFCLDGSGMRTVATAIGDESGIRMEVITDQIGLQFYAGNFINSAKGKCGKEYPVHGGFALETQHYPNCINEKSFANPFVKAGEVYNTKTSYRFTV